MNNRMRSAGLLAIFCGLMLNGCGSERNVRNAEQPHTTTSVVTERTTVTDKTETDRDNALYEEDDVHRKTERDEPDIIDRAESAVDSAESVLTELATDAEQKLDDMHETDHDRARSH